MWFFCFCVSISTIVFLCGYPFSCCCFLNPRQKSTLGGGGREIREASESLSSLVMVCVIFAWFAILAFVTCATAVTTSHSKGLFLCGCLCDANCIGALYDNVNSAFSDRGGVMRTLPNLNNQSDADVLAAVQAEVLLWSPTIAFIPSNLNAREIVEAYLASTISTVVVLPVDTAFFDVYMNTTIPSNVFVLTTRWDLVGYAVGAGAAVQTSTKRVLLLCVNATQSCRTVAAGFDLAVANASATAYVAFSPSPADAAEVVSRLISNASIDVVVAVGKAANAVAYTFADRLFVIAVGSDEVGNPLTYNNTNSSRSRNLVTVIYYDVPGAVESWLDRKLGGDSPSTTIGSVWMTVEKCVFSCQVTKAALVTDGMLMQFNQGAVVVPFDPLRNMIKYSGNATKVVSLAHAGESVPFVSPQVVASMADVYILQDTPPRVTHYDFISNSFESLPSRIASASFGVHHDGGRGSECGQVVRATGGLSGAAIH